MIRLLRKAMTLSRDERREAFRRRAEFVKGSLLLGKVGLAVNRANSFAYISYVPDAIREYGKMPDFSRVVEVWTKGNARRNAGDLPRMLFLAQNAQRVIMEGIPGHFAELGVHKGHSARLLADVLRERDDQRRLYLFDTFDGFDERDLEGVDARVAPIYSDTSLAAVKELVGNIEICDYRPGYFPDSATGIAADARFAFVHLDCDLYEPTRAALSFFYERLSSGGFIVVHDYSSGHWPGVPQAVEEFLADKPEHLVLMPDKSGTAIFRKQ
jgi:hypothetical protein